MDGLVEDDIVLAVLARHLRVGRAVAVGVVAEQDAIDLQTFGYLHGCALGDAHLVVVLGRGEDDEALVATGDEVGAEDTPVAKGLHLVRIVRLLRILRSLLVRLVCLGWTGSCFFLLIGLDDDAASQIYTHTQSSLIDHHDELLVARGRDAQFHGKYGTLSCSHAHRERRAGLERAVDTIGEVLHAIACFQHTYRLGAVGIDAGAIVVEGNDLGSLGRVVEDGILVGRIGVVDVHDAEVGTQQAIGVETDLVKLRALGHFDGISQLVGVLTTDQLGRNGCRIDLVAHLFALIVNFHVHQFEDVSREGATLGRHDKTSLDGLAAV